MESVIMSMLTIAGMLFLVLFPILVPIGITSFHVVADRRRTFLTGARSRSAASAIAN
jgi:hypothetical protein